MNKPSDLTGDMNRRLSEEECRVAGKAAAQFMQMLGGTTREQAVYTISVIIAFMANRDRDGQLEIIEELRSLV